MSSDILTSPGPVESRLLENSTIEPKNVTVEIVVISLPTAAQRRRNIDAMFRGTGFNWTYFDAHIALKHPGLRYELGEVKRLFGRTLSGPETCGVTSSRFRTMRPA